MDIDELEPLIYIFIITVLVLIGANYYNKYQCKNKSDLMKLNYRYSFVSGCMVEHKPTVYIPIEQYRVID
jgi:hypothetical protein